MTAAGIANSATQVIPGGSIAVVTHVGVGKLSYLQFPYATSQDFVSLAELRADPRCLCYLLGKRLQADSNVVQGSAIKGITKDDLMDKVLSFPGREEQRRIGILFSRLDSLITLHRRECMRDSLHW